MDARVQTAKEKTARRIGMSVVVVLIVWTIVAVATSVIRTLGTDEPPAIEQAD